MELILIVKALAGTLMTVFLSAPYQEVWGGTSLPLASLFLCKLCA